jgi:hypothetical protein
VPTISLTSILDGSAIIAADHRNNYAAIQAAVNALDQSNWAVGKIFDPAKLMQNGALAGQALVWNTGTSQWQPGTISAPPIAATVATTVAGLGTTFAGALGLLRLGASPFEFIALTYDATYGHWVSPVFDLGLVCSNASSNSSSDVQIGRAALLPYGAFVTAGLTLQTRGYFTLTETGTGETATCSMKLGTQAQNGALGSTGAFTATYGSVAIPAPVTATPYLGDTGWASPASAPTSAAYAAIQATARTSGTANAKNFDAQLAYRWIA